MNDHDDIESAILDELIKAKKKYPDWPDDMVHQAAIVSEESGELIRAVLNHVYHDGSIEDVRNEAIQTAAMAIRFLENLNEDNDAYTITMTYAYDTDIPPKLSCKYTEVNSKLCKGE